MSLKLIWVISATLLLFGCADGQIAPASDLPGGPMTKATKVDLSAQYCSKPTYCGEMGRLDCNSAADGPLYYFDKATKDIISTCGGACMMVDGPNAQMCQTQCPPPEWTCADE